MILINHLITAFFDIIFYPFINLPAVWGLLFISVVTGLVMLVIFKHTSNQDGIKATKQIIKGLFLELRIYKDDLKQSLQSQKRLLRTNITYMKYSVIPMLIMIGPVILILIQLNFRFSYRPLKPGDECIVKITVGPNIYSLDDVQLIVPEGVIAQTKPLRIPMKAEVDWRIKALSEGNHFLRFNINGSEYTYPLIISSALHRVYPDVMQPGWWEPLLYPGAPFPDDDSPITNISISYPDRSTPILGFNIHWLITFFVLSIIAGFALKKPFGVQI